MFSLVTSVHKRIPKERSASMSVTFTMPGTGKRGTFPSTCSPGTWGVRRLDPFALFYY